MPLPINAEMYRKYRAHRAEIGQIAKVEKTLQGKTEPEAAAVVAAAPSDWGQTMEDFFDDHLTWGNILKLGAASLIGGFAVSRVLGGVEFTKEKTYDKK